MKKYFYEINPEGFYSWEKGTYSMVSFYKMPTHFNVEIYELALEGKVWAYIVKVFDYVEEPNNEAVEVFKVPSFVYVHKFTDYDGSAIYVVPHSEVVFNENVPQHREVVETSLGFYFILRDIIARVPQRKLKPYNSNAIDILKWEEKQRKEVLQ